MPINFEELLDALKNAITANAGTKEDFIASTKTAIAHDREKDSYSFAMAALVATLAAEREHPDWSKDKLQEFASLTTDLLKEHVGFFDGFYEVEHKSDEKPAETAQNADLKAALKSIADLF